MKRLFLLALLLLLPLSAHAATITFTVNPGDIGVKKVGSFGVFSGDLNGTTLAGQTLSLDLVFGGDVLARFYEPFPLHVSLTVFTNAGGFPGFSGAATSGYLLNPDGTQKTAEQLAGRSMSEGSFSSGLIDALNQREATDIKGAHMNLVLPNTGFTVTNARLLFSMSANPSESMVFGTPAQIPEPSTLLLLALGVPLILLFNRAAILK